MKSFTSLTTEAELKKKFARDVRDRNIDQKFLYINRQGLKYYYDAVEQDKQGNHPSQKEYFESLKRNIKKDEKIAVVSLGCGNASTEKYALEHLHKNGYDIIYVGVDISHGMVQEAERNLKKIEIEKYFVVTDILTERFKEEIMQITNNCDHKFFSFIGGTLGNVNQTNIADTLCNLLSTDDIILIDVRIRINTTLEDDLKIFNRYSQFLDNNYTPFIFHPLENIGVPKRSGNLKLKMEKENSVGALLFIFYFQFSEKVIIQLEGEYVHFLPDEEIKLLTIRAYHPKTLKSFFQEHKFHFIDSTINNNRGQFVFKR